MNVVVGICAALIGLVGVWLGGRLSRQRWQNDKKLEAAAEFIVASGHLHRVREQSGPLSRANPDIADWFNKLRDARWRLALLCGPNVLELVQRMVDDLDGEGGRDASGKAVGGRYLDALIPELRRELRMGLVSDVRSWMVRPFRR